MTEHEAAGVDPSVAEGTWRRASNAVRAALTLLVTLLFALLLDGWMRFFVLPWYRIRGDEAGRIRAMNGLVRLWGRFTVLHKKFFLGLRIEVRGRLPEAGRYIVVANHQSSLDIPVLIDALRMLNLKFVAKEELRRGKPGVSIALRNGGFAFLEKKSLADDLAALRRFASAMESYDGSPAIFPEGIRTFDGRIQDFHLGGTEAVRRECGLPLLPVTLDGLWQARNIWQYGRLVRARVTVLVSDPIPSDEFGRDPFAAGRRIEELIRANLAQIRRTDDC